MAFTNIKIGPIQYNLSGSYENSNNLFTIQNLSNTENDGAILMHIDDKNQYASIDHFFYLNGEIDKNELFKTLVTCDPGDKSEARYHLVKDIMDILLHIAFFHKCNYVILFDAAMNKTYHLCNDIYRGPHYLNYYSRHYGFMHSPELNFLLNKDTFPMADILQLLHTITLEAALEQGTDEQIKNQYYAQQKFGPLHRKLEYIVSRYYAYFRHEKKTPPSTKLPSCEGYMIKYIDPVDKEWICYNPKKNQKGHFYIGDIDKTFSIKGDVLFIDE